MRQTTTNHAIGFLLCHSGTTIRYSNSLHSGFTSAAHQGLLYPSCLISISVPSLFYCRQGVFCACASQSRQAIRGMNEQYHHLSVPSHCTSHMAGISLPSLLCSHRIRCQYPCSSNRSDLLSQYSLGLDRYQNSLFLRHELVRGVLQRFISQAHPLKLHRKPHRG